MEEEQNEQTFVPTVNSIINPLHDTPPILERSDPCDATQPFKLPPCSSTVEVPPCPSITVQYKPQDIMEMIAISAIFGAGLALAFKYAFSKSDLNA